MSEEGISIPSPLSSRLYRSAVGKRRLCHRPGKAMGLSRSKLENVLPQTDVWVLHASKVSLIHKTLTHVEVGTRCRRFLAPCSLAGRRASNTTTSLCEQGASAELHNKHQKTATSHEPDHHRSRNVSHKHGELPHVMARDGYDTLNKRAVHQAGEQSRLV